MQRIVVLGGGMVGSVIAADLADDYEVLIVDKSDSALEKNKPLRLKTQRADFTQRSVLEQLIRHADLVIGAIPGYLAYPIIEAVLAAGKNIVDISFFPEDPFLLEKIARQNGVTLIPDAGIAPGLSNMIAGFHDAQGNCTSFLCYVGGLPLYPQPPFYYKAPFSPVDVIEEYTRPARIKINGNIEVREPLSEPEFLDFDNIGVLEAFLSDGLRTLLKTVNIPHMEEKTLRVPGHREAIVLLRDAGFFNLDPVEFDSLLIKPIDFTSTLLISNWKLEKGEKEYTIMRILASHLEDGLKKKHVYELYDKTDEMGLSSMSRTTGFTCSALARLWLNGTINETGVVPPEVIARKEGNLLYVMNYLKSKGISIKHSIEIN